MKPQKWVFDTLNNRIVVEDDSINVLYTDDLETPNKVFEKIVEIHNSDITANQLGSTGSIDEYLLDEGDCSEDDREFIVEELYINYFSRITDK